MACQVQITLVILVGGGGGGGAYLLFGDHRKS